MESDPAGPSNPFGVGFSAKETVLTSEQGAKRRVNSESSRVWKIVNHDSRNVVTGAPGALSAPSSLLLGEHGERSLPACAGKLAARTICFMLCAGVASSVALAW